MWDSNDLFYKFAKPCYSDVSEKFNFNSKLLTTQQCIIKSSLEKKYYQEFLYTIIVLLLI